MTKILSDSVLAIAFAVAALALCATNSPVQADGPEPRLRQSRTAVDVGPPPVPGPAYRFSSGYSGPPVISTPPWGYLFGGGYAESPAFNFYAPGYSTGPAYGAAPKGRYYASPCYFERQQVWDGYRWRINNVKICR